VNLYIANATMQNRIANLRVPEVTKNIQLNIARGRQVRVPKDLAQQDVDSIVEQMSKYGSIKIDEIGSKRSYATTIPYILSVDKPVPVTAIKRVLDHNKGVLKLRGDEVRQQAALASSQVMEEAAPGTLDNFETTLIEEKSGGMVHEGDEKPVAEGLRVSGNDVATPGTERTAKGPGKRR